MSRPELSRILARVPARLHRLPPPARCALLLLAAICVTSIIGAEENSSLDNLKSMSIEELLSIEIVSASRQTSKYATTPAAVYVISREDIHHSGATSIPEVLRMAPGLHVARLDSGRWAVSARGFNSLYANKLLVLIDGRSIYSELFSGVYWELLDLPLADIERIEIIRGPGGATWGANAVNGVINIITRKTTDDGPPELELAAGSTAPRWSSTLRYIGKGDNSGLRISASAIDRGEFDDDTGRSSGDSTRNFGLNARYDWTPSKGKQLLLTANVSQAQLNRAVSTISSAPPYRQTQRADASSLSQSLLARWKSTDASNEANSWSAQAYLAKLDHEGLFYSDRSTTLDLEVQRTLALRPGHTLSFGAGARFWRSAPHDAPVVHSLTNTSNFSLFSSFFQYEWSPEDSRFSLSLGAKVEDNDFTGFEFQPTVAGSWKLSDHSFLWASVSRAVKTPDRAETESELDAFYLPTQPLPTLLRVQPNPDLGSEDLLAYQLGIRGTMASQISYDVVLFYHDYHDLAGPFVADPQLTVYDGLPTVLLPLVWQNGARARSVGAEVAINADLGSRTALKASYTYIDLSADQIVDGKEVLFFFGQAGLTPRQSATLQLTHHLGSRWSVSVLGRYTSALHPLDWSEVTGIDTARIDSVTSADLIVHWHMKSDVAFFLAAKDLLDERHVEFYEYAFGNRPNSISRRVFLAAKFSF